MKFYRAPWSKTVVIVSIVVTLICIAVSVPHWGHVVAGHVEHGRFWAGVLPIAILLGAVPFMIRGYTLSPGLLKVHRLFTTTHIPLTGLELVRVDAEAFKRSWRLCGNGGLFSVSGWYRSPAVGLFRAFVTDPKLSVVLKLANRTIVVSPHDPEEFASEVSRLAAA